jgi:hypothetical protein
MLVYSRKSYKNLLLILEIHIKTCFLFYKFKENSYLIKKFLVNTCLISKVLEIVENYINS